MLAVLLVVLWVWEVCGLAVLPETVLHVLVGGVAVWGVGSCAIETGWICLNCTATLSPTAAWAVGGAVCACE